MKKILLLIFAIAPLLCFSQGMKITWEDSEGREYSINTHSRNFQYSMVARDQMYYNKGYSSDTGPKGSVKKVGGLTVYYNKGYSSDTGPEGSIKKTSGSVNYN